MRSARPRRSDITAAWANLAIARFREPVDHLQRSAFVFRFDLRQLVDTEIDK